MCIKSHGKFGKSYVAVSGQSMLDVIFLIETSLILTIILVKKTILLGIIHFANSKNRIDDFRN